VTALDPPGPVRRRLPAPRYRRAVLAAGVAAALLGTLGNGPAPQAQAQAQTARPAVAACPPNLLGKATCYTGQDANGAYYAMAVPTRWNRSLVVHAHGGPDLGDSSDPARSTDDLQRWAVMVEEGYAWAGSSYRRGGYGTRMAAADTENVRRLFVSEFGKPKRTYVHGQSWGGDIAAKVAETYGRHPGAYDGALLTSGVLGGGSRGYDYRVDLRVVYQYYCHNHPRTSTTSSPSPASRSARSHPICSSPPSRSATSCRPDSAAATPSPTRVCGTRVHTTTRRSTQASNASRPTPPHAATSPTTAI
jgi:hypothetical protein